MSNEQAQSLEQRLKAKLPDDGDLDPEAVSHPALSHLV